MDYTPVRSLRLGAVMALMVAVSGCANDFDTSGAWFSRSLDLFGSKSGYTYSNLDETRLDRPITSADLVDANGACPARPVPTPAAAPPAAGDARGNTDTSAEMAALLGAGVAIGMSECDVVARLGRPTAVNLGTAPNGERSAVLTFQTGPRPGVYRFAGGRLKEMDSVEPPPPAPKATKKRSAGKRPADGKQSATAGKS